MSRDTGVYVRCPACRGRGHVRKFLCFHWICRVCEGTGSLSEIDPFSAALRIEGVMRAVLGPPTVAGLLMLFGIIACVIWRIW